MTIDQTTKAIEGLSSDEVQLRVERGDINIQEAGLTPSYKEIVRKNTITLFNIVNTVLVVALILVGHIENTLFYGIVICNIAMGIFQEVRAKKTLDKLSILAQAEATVLRDGKETPIPQDEIVLDDIVHLKRGDQICADSVISESHGLQVDESLLTGESEKINKEPGDKVLSGSFVTSGQAYAKVTAVGKYNYASSISTEAKTKKKEKSKLLKTLDLIIKIVTIVIIPLGGILFYVNYFVNGESIQTTVLGVSAALTGMIPSGLVVLTGVTMTVSAVNLTRHKALAQSLDSIETLARVDVLCLDKTGTITDGSLKFEQLDIIGKKGSYVKTAISELMCKLNDDNATASILTKEFGKTDEWEAANAIPFSSDRKWSGVTFREMGSYILGSPEIVFPGTHAPWAEQVKNYAKEGLRVICLAHSEQEITSETLPSDLACQALIVLSDNIRENAVDTFRYFAKEGMEIKVISGDNPVTVSTVARKAEIANSEKYVDMQKVQDSDAGFRQLVKDYTVFGHVTPQQKKRLINALKENGHTTCMTGDGVNDILAMRESNCSVAMVSGNSAARSASDFVLMESDFGSMINALKEGRRVINNIQRVASLYIVNCLCSMLLTLIYIFIAFPFPYVPLQMTMVNVFTVGVPSFILALMPNYGRPEDRFYKNMFEYAFPTSITIVINTLFLQLAAYVFKLNQGEFSTAVVFLIGVVSIFLLFRISSPYTLGTKIMLAGMTVGFAVLFLFFYSYFSLESLFSRTAFFYVPLIFVSYQINKVLGKWCTNILDFIEYRADKKAKKHQQESDSSKRGKSR